MIFLDNAGTTRMFDECVSTYSHFACQEFYNPSAVSKKSSEIHSQIESVRKLILKKLHAFGGTVIFTGGATESNNLAVKGSVRNGDYEYVFSVEEHPSVFNVAKSLEKEGRGVKFIGIGKDGKIDLKSLENILSTKTRLISCMLVSNETGAINDIREVSKLRDRICPNAVLHVDAVQGFMKIPFSVEDLKIDLMSFSAHKFHGPKGVGGLYVRDMKLIKNIVDGGGQEFGMRSGTENVPGIMALKTALEKIDVKANFDHVTELKQKFNKVISENSSIKILDLQGSPYIECLIFPNVKGETMLHALEDKGVIVGLGSACSAKKAGNRVLQEIGLSNEDIISSCRISFNAYQNAEEVESAGKIILEVYADLLKKLS